MPKLLLLLGLSLSLVSCQESEYMSTNEVLLFNQCALRSTEIIHKTIQADLVDLRVNNFDKPYYLPILEKIETIEQSKKSVYDSLSLLQQRVASFPLEIPIKRAHLTQFQALNKSAHRLQTQHLQLIYKAWNHEGIKATIFADTTRRLQSIQHLEARLSPIILNRSKNALSISTNSILSTTLGVLQQNIKQNETVFVNFLIGQTGKMGFGPCGWFSVATNSSKTCIRLGETYETTITFLEQMPHDHYKLIVEGDTLEMVDDKSSKFSISTQTIGEQCFWTALIITDPLTKEQTSLYKPFYFEVSR